MRRYATTTQGPTGERLHTSRDIRLRAAKRAEREHRRLHSGADAETPRTCDAAPRVSRRREVSRGCRALRRIRQGLRSVGAGWWRQPAQWSGDVQDAVKRPRPRARYELD